MKMQRQIGHPIKVEFQGRIRRFRVLDDDYVIPSLARILGVEPGRLFVHDGERVLKLESVVGDQESVQRSRLNGSIPRFYAELKPAELSPDKDSGTLVWSLQKIHQTVDNILFEVQDIKRTMRMNSPSPSPNMSASNENDVSTDIAHPPISESGVVPDTVSHSTQADMDDYASFNESEISESFNTPAPKEERDDACIALEPDSESAFSSEVDSPSANDVIEQPQLASYLSGDRNDIDADSLSSGEDIDSLDDDLIDRMADVICESCLSDDLDDSRHEPCNSGLSDSFVVIRRQSLQQSQQERLQSLSASIKKVEAEHSDVLERLAAMGFSNSKLNASVLLTHNYDFQATAEALERFKSMSMDM